MDIIIFGAGMGGTNTFSLLSKSSDCKIIAFSDNNKSLWYTTKSDVEIIPPEQINKFGFHKIIIASQYRKEIIPQLLALGIPSEKIEVAHQNLMDGISINPNIFEKYTDKKVPSYKPYISVREETFITLAKYTELVVAHDVEGDIAEFGCGTGQSTYMMAKTLKEAEQYYHTPAKQFHLFDSFEGLPESNNTVDLSSPLVQAGIWSECACASISDTETRDPIGARSRL
ncbi:TylF/MycF/NovP-related O-methyltransferase [Pseudoalteromonas xiamenensis]|uniref:TylF/MycF/NovP-related O-methyltransferase n=1 Tax=Pseudoalteromonas xiamenensis TaxID=882626 RepID=UPI00244E030E|nr:TylF/MycF/NovP-related O-methyltransferase [Pseudoalteromonas xiamenensis]